MDEINVDTLKAATAVLKKAWRRYSSAVARIRRVEQFLQMHIEGLGYDLEPLYGELESFKCPPESLNIGLSYRDSRSFIIYFAKVDGEWHFQVAPVRCRLEEGKLIEVDKAMRLIGAPAEIVLSQIDGIDRYAADILENLAVLVAASSGGKATYAPPEATESNKLTQDPSKGGVH
ncbi:MAG: hypothetical protein ACMG6S_34310 [Byssovorax sp.]